MSHTVNPFIAALNFYPSFSQRIYNNDIQKKIVNNLELEERVFANIPRPAYATLKDHKQDFQNKPTVRLVNPYKLEIQKISKQILDKKLFALREATKFNQFKNSYSVIEWFKDIPNKDQCKFLVFDICEFYPSISEELFNEAMRWASTIVYFSAGEKEILVKSKHSLLWNKGTPWKKRKNPDFDVTIGSYDGAETCDLVGLFLLSQLQDLGLSIGLFRDDGLAVSRFRGRQTEKVSQKIRNIFDKYNLKLDIQTNKTVVNYLDITLDLSTGE